MRCFKSVLVCLLLIAYCLLFGIPLYADELSELKEQVRAMQAEMAKMQEKIESLEKNKAAKSEIPEHIDTHILHKGLGAEIAKGLELGVSAAFIAQGTPNANNAGTSEDSILDGSYSVDVEIEKGFGDFGAAFLHLEAGQGDTVESELSLFSNVNRNTEDSSARAEVTEVWYEHYLFDGQLTLTAGKLDATAYLDQNAYANDETRQFLGRIFRNSPAIEFPDDNGAGLRAFYSPSLLEFMEIEAGYLEADADWDDIFENPFMFTQFNFKPHTIIPKFREYEGNYRLYTWINNTFYLESQRGFGWLERG